MPISVTIITQNEADNIEACLEAAKQVADEIVVVDSGSTDGTQQLCQIMGARVIEQDFLGYVGQKNKATDAATHDYILSLDADEVLSEALIASILAVKKNWEADAYRFNRLNHYNGHPIRYGGWYPDRKTRLFDRRKARWGGGQLHETIVVEKGATVKHLEGDLLHHSYQNIADHLARMNRYTDIMAAEAAAKGEFPSILKIIFAPIWKFWQMYLFKGGFLDGYYGFVVAVMGSYYKFLKYTKTREAQQNQ
ncbi:MAG: glycosyltransferase family 2 protein [Bacteroidota bacterium]